MYLNVLFLFMHPRQCFFSVESAVCRPKFMVQLNNSFGSGGMSLAFNKAQFAAFIELLKIEQRQHLAIRKAACTIG